MRVGQQPFGHAHGQIGDPAFFNKRADVRIGLRVRGAFADDGGSLLQKSLSLGVGYQTTAFSGLLGVGLNWGEPNDDTFGPGLSDQYAIEAFYRMPIGDRFAVTADTQFIKDPALNTSESTIWMFNVRARFAF